MKASFLIAAAFLVTTVAQAQETVAAGSLNNQMSWTALSNQINALNGKLTVLNTRVGVVETTVKEVKDELVLVRACGNKGLLYGPSHAQADKSGCVAIEKPVSMYLHARERRYQPTGVYVKKGQKFTISVTGMASSGYEHVYYTADDRFSTGKFGAKSCMLRFALTGSKEFHPDVYDYTGTSFCGKSSLTMTASSSGYLYAGIIEGASNSGDNQGGYMISITLKN